MKRLLIALVTVFAMTQLSQAQVLPPGGCPCIPEEGSHSFEQQFLAPHVLSSNTQGPGAGWINPLIVLRANADLEDGEFQQINSYTFTIAQGANTGFGQVTISDKQMWIDWLNPSIISWFIILKYSSYNGDTEYFLQRGEISYQEFLNGGGMPIMY